MRVSLKWLREYVDVTLPVEELAAKLTASGTEVGGIARTGGSWDRVQVARVTRIQPHPNAGRLKLATVALPEGEKTVVCGAPNVQEGQKVAFAHAGAVLIDGHTGQPAELKPARIRGVVSEGMVCSEKELGLSEDHEGILVLPEDAPVGVPLAGYLGDTVLDLEVTPNRPDCYSVLGVAREVAVITGQPLREPDRSYAEAGDPIEGRAAVEILDPDLCYRYTASLVTGVRIGPSPGWMQERLLAAGMRPINNIVDITNYVMLELGQPLHAFDYDRVRDRRIVVRRARPGERMTTLDGVERAFTPEMLLICDGSGPVALGGIIGGAESEVTEGTTAILLESACFNHISIRRSESTLRERTEASLRFDKGLHPQSAEEGLRRATKLLVELCGGTAARGIIDVYPAPREQTTVDLTRKRLATVLGIEPEQTQVRSILEALGCRVDGDFAHSLRVSPPWWRPDLRIPDDLAEEVIRVIGYDSLPFTTVRGEIPHHQPDHLRETKERVRDVLVAAGMQEIITYSVTSLAGLEKIAPPPAAGGQPPIRVANPMSAEQEYLRTSLRPGLLSTLAFNQRNAEGPIALFEAARSYLPQPGDLPEEREQLAGLFAGPAREPHWRGTPEPVNYYDAKGLLEALLDRLGVPGEFAPGDDPDLHPGRTAIITAGGETLGVLGEVHPQVLLRFDVETRPVLLFELDLAALARHVQPRRQYRPISRFPAVTEDLAVVVDAVTPGGAVQRAIAESPLVAGVRVFDVYTGPPVPAGKQSLAFSITYQAPDRTLTAQDVAGVRQRIVARLRGQFGAQLRE